MAKRKIFIPQGRGNSCDVLGDMERLRSDPTGGMEWDVFPSASEDREVWSEKCYPVVCRKAGEQRGCDGCAKRSFSHGSRGGQEGVFEQ